MAVAGYKAVIQVGNATTVSVTNEACTSLSASVYRVTSSSRRVLDPGQSVVVKDATVTVSSSLYSVEYLTGKITFSGYSPGGAITVDAYYVPMVTVAECQSYEVSVESGLAEKTPYNTDGVKTYMATLMSASVAMSGTLSPWTDYTGEGVAGITAYMTSSTPRVWRLQFYDGVNYLVANIWGFHEGYKQSAPVDGITKFDTTIQATSRSGKSFGLDTW